MLLQSDNYSIFSIFYEYGPGWAAMNLIAGIASAVIMDKKGQGAYQIVLHLLFGLFCFGMGSLISALMAKDLATEERLYELESKVRRQRHQLRSGQVGLSDVGGMGTVPGTRVGQVSCPSCGRMNDVGVDVCWDCNEDLSVPSSLIPSEPPSATEPRSPKPSVPDSTGPVQDSMRIACRACGRRFSGRKGKIQQLRKCPKCGTAPFDYRRLPTKSV